MDFFKRKKAEPSSNEPAGNKTHEIAVNMSGNSYFIVDIDSLVNSTVVQQQAKKAKEAIPST